MGCRVFHAGFLKGFLLFLFGGAYLVISSGCQSTSYSAPRQTEETKEIRSELVLLNVPEASGWVAYHCTPEDEPEMEDYRVVVIRQQTGTIIYDSQIPLATDLCTHGFEMAPDDPRLLRLARTVDSSIIEPLEAFQRDQPEPEPTVKSAEPESPAETETSSDATASDEKSETAETGSVEDEETATSDEPAGTSVRSRAEEMEEKSPFRMGAFENELLHIEVKEAGSLKIGDRLFVRNPPQMIALPGTNEQILVSEGEVIGLVEVVSTEDLTATAKLLNGEIPERGHLEKTD